VGVRLRSFLVNDAQDLLARARERGEADVQEDQRSATSINDNDSDSPGTGGLSRRGFLAGVAGAGAATALSWTPAFQVPAGSVASALPTPPSFPAGIPLYQQAFQNWAKEIVIDAVWTCAPATPAQVVTIANWARAQGYKVRPRGAMHNWSPLTITKTQDLSKVLLVDLTQNVKTITVTTGTTPKTVTAQAGATMEAILTALQAQNLGLGGHPAIGNLTLGGALAIDAHGASLPKSGETLTYGHTYGSLSHLVTSLTAVVWSSTTSQYELKTFNRSDSEIKAFLVHLGRAFLVSATLQVGANYRLRCQSWYNVPTAELFGPAGTSGRTFNSYLTSSGRVEAIWFPFTDTPWIKVWTPTPNKPILSRQVSSPYNYSFSDQIPDEFETFLSQLASGNTSGTPSFGGLQLFITQSGIVFTGTWDIWGWSKDVLLYVRPTTLRYSENGMMVMTNRSNVQRVLNEFSVWYKAKLAAYQAQGKFPVNGPVEIRCSGLDQPGDVKVASSGTAQLSALRPRSDRPTWDTAVWFDVLTIAGTPDSITFYREMEQWMQANYSGTYAGLRGEWSKGWAYSSTAAWADPTYLGTTVPNNYRTGQPAGDNWDTARATLNKYDPHRIFSNPFLDTLLP
jgi:FAD/FMN-containing dehydrogenase